MTCLLRVELCAEVFKGVGDEFAGVEQGAYGGVYGDGAVDGVFFADLVSGHHGMPINSFQSP